jgi:hypothetical protein
VVTAADGLTPELDVSSPAKVLRRPCPFRDAPPAITPLDAAHRERRASDQRRPRSIAGALRILTPPASSGARARCPPPTAGGADGQRAVKGGNRDSCLASSETNAAGLCESDAIFEQPGSDILS